MTRVVALLRFDGVGVALGFVSALTLAGSEAFGAAAPGVKLTASPATVKPGGAAQLSWKATNAKSCSASGGWSGKKGLSGKQSTGRLSATRTYTLSCSSGSVGAKSSARVTVRNTSTPTVTLSASPSVVTTNGTSKLTWSVIHATSCSASGGWSGSKGTSGSHTTAPLKAATTYTLACTGAGGATTRSVVVSVGQTSPITVSLTANSKSVPFKGSSTLTWTSKGATGCSASGGWSGSRSTHGSATVGPITRDTTYSLTCSGGGKQGVAMTTVVLREARLNWTWASPKLKGLASYRVHYGPVSKKYTKTIAVTSSSTLQASIALLPGTWYFAVAALDAVGRELARSNEVNKAIPH